WRGRWCRRPPATAPGRRSPSGPRRSASTSATSWTSRAGTARCSSWRAATTTSGAAAATRFFAGGGGGGDARFELDRQGTFYFASGVPGRCEAGQRMAVSVAGDVTTAPPPPPTVVFKLTPSAGVWMATVVVFLIILIGVIACCVDVQSKLMAVFIGALGARLEQYC
ncbi:unnamed protein product, partial [Urochloa humidicola]